MDGFDAGRPELRRIRDRDHTEPGDIPLLPDGRAGRDPLRERLRQPGGHFRSNDQRTSGDRTMMRRPTQHFPAAAAAAAGFTLVETILCMIVIAVMLSASMAVVSSSVKSQYKAAE